MISSHFFNYLLSFRKIMPMPIFVSHLLAKLRNNAYICRTLKSFFELELQKPTTNNI